jgi:hypothetical protein
MKAILILALLVVFLATGCGGYGHNSPGGGTSTSSGGY